MEEENQGNRPAAAAGDEYLFWALVVSSSGICFAMDYSISEYFQSWANDPNLLTVFFLCMAILLCTGCSSCLVVGIDLLFLRGVQVLRLSRNNNQNPGKKSWLTKDLCHMISLAAGLVIQQNFISFMSFLLWISCLAWVITWSLYLKRPVDDYGLIDLFIVLLIQVVIYFNMTKAIIFYLPASVLCLGLIILRHRFDEVRNKMKSASVLCVGLVIMRNHRLFILRNWRIYFDQISKDFEAQQYQNLQPQSPQSPQAWRNNWMKYFDAVSEYVACHQHENPHRNHELHHHRQMWQIKKQNDGDNAGGHDSAVFQVLSGVVL